jgi:uncharacterized protein (TIGR03086 family)
MSETAARDRQVAGGFTARVEAVPPDGWDRPSPCEGWTARDVVGHLAESARGFLSRGGVDLPDGPSAEDDPPGAWAHTRDHVLAVLEDPELAGRRFETGMGEMSLEEMVGRFGVGDVLVHTWDLARAVGLDDTLDPDEVHRLLQTMEPNDELMRQGTAFGPKVPVPDDADEQTRLIAFTGRRP